PLREGDPGVHLIEPRDDKTYYDRPGWRAAAMLESVWLYELFGSEALSARGAAIASRVPAPYVLLHPDTAAALGLAAGAQIHVDADGQDWQATLRISDALPAGLAGVPRG